MGTRGIGPVDTQFSSTRETTAPTGKRGVLAKLLKRLGFKQAKTVEVEKQMSLPASNTQSQPKKTAWAKVVVTEPQAQMKSLPAESQPKEKVNNERHTHFGANDVRQVEKRVQKFRPDYFAGLNDALNSRDRSDFRAFIENHASAKEIIKTKAYLGSKNQLVGHRAQVLDQALIKLMAAEVAGRLCFVRADGASSPADLKNQINRLCGDSDNLQQAMSDVRASVPLEHIQQQSQLLSQVRRELQENMQEADILFETRRVKTPNKKARNREALRRNTGYWKS